MALVVIELIQAPEKLRGALQRKILEVRSGLFVGELSQRIREEVWAEVKNHMRFGSAIIISPAKTESGFLLRTHGADRREVVFFDGSSLVRYTKNWKK